MHSGRGQGRASWGVVLLVATVAAVLVPAATASAAEPPALELRPIVEIEGLTAFATRRGDATRYVAQQSGTVLAVDRRTVREVPVLDITGDVTGGGEQGLLGIAFSPDGS